MACELVSTCPFFNERMRVRSEVLTLYRIRYCRGQHIECARYLVYSACGRAAVPNDLYPGDKLEALRIVRNIARPAGQTPANPAEPTVTEPAAD